MNEIEILDVIALTEALPTEGLQRGEVGTVVDRWADGVFEVEFSYDTGEAYAFATVRADQMLKLYFSRDKQA